MKRRIIQLLAGIAAVLASCTDKPEAVLPGEEQPLKLQTKVAGLQAAAADLVTDDSVGIFITKSEGGVETLLRNSGNYADNVPCVYRYQALETGSRIYYPLDREDLVVYAYYPYTGNLAELVDIPFAVATDQREEKAFRAGDFLWARQVVRYNNVEDAVLTFTHCMSRVVIRLTAGSGVASAEGAEVLLSGLAVRGYVNLNSGGIRVKDGTAPAEIIPRSTEPGVYEVLIPPQYVAEARRMIRVTLGGKVYSWVTPAGGCTFPAGKTTTFELTLADE